ncbi:Uncharacterized protein APZ42_001441 [Daphnia magna]|uniref:Uncharacterized protein n=1 Tax=Daphnia magna TaxID=35525 RepID=A0A164IZH3_9CRUS|nr:Uncharacterized protein APZ42_001441 [Daphnia magna]
MEDFKSLVKQTDRNDLIYFLIYKPNSAKSPSATEKPIESVKSLESYKKYIDGYLRDTCAMKLSNGKSVVKGMVTHSMAFSKPPLNCWVVLHSHGGVACGHCDCIGGLGGTYSHVGVLLWGVVNISEETCTSTIQRWHNKSATKHPVSVAFTFYTMKHVKHDLNSIYFQELPTPISQLKTSQKTKRRDDEY